MKQQVKPGMMVAAIAGVLAIVGIVIYFMSSRSDSPSAAATSSLSGTQPGSVQTPVRDKSPDDIVKEHRKQMPQGGGGPQ